MIRFLSLFLFSLMCMDAAAARAMDDPAWKLRQLNEAAAQDIAAQQMDLAEAYYYGLYGIPQDMAQAYYWFAVCDYHLANSGIAGQGDFLSRAFDGGFSALYDTDPRSVEAKAMTNLLVDPQLKDICVAMRRASASRLSQASKRTADAKLRQWAASHPHPVTAVNPRERTRRYLTLRLAMAIGAPGDPSADRDIDGVRSLIAAGADAKAPMLLLNAAAAGKTSVVRALVENGADIHIVNSNGSTPLAQAAQFGHADTVQYLITKGGDARVTDKFGQTPLLLAAVNGDLETVKALVAAGADASVKDSSGETPVMAAARMKHANVEAFLTGRPVPPPSPAPKLSAPATSSPLAEAVADPANARSQDMIERLTMGTPADRRRAMTDVAAKPGDYDPIVLDVLSGTLFDGNRDRDGYFWFLAARLRGTVDFRTCHRKDNGYGSGLGNSEVALLYSRYAPDDAAGLVPLVVAWDRRTPVNYNRQWGSSPSTCFAHDRWDGIRQLATSEFAAEMMRATRDDRPKASMDALMPKAAAGDAAAQYDLAQCYANEYQCRLPDRDLVRITDHWAQQELAQEHAVVKTTSGLDLRPEHEDRMRFWLEKAAAQNHPPALFALAQYYLNYLQRQVSHADPRKACSLMLRALRAKYYDTYLMMAFAPWNPDGGTMVDRYAWSMVENQASHPGSPDPGDAWLSDADYRTGTARGKVYIERYLRQATPICDPATLPTGDAELKVSPSSHSRPHTP